jgi:hypothetical protein
MLTPTQYATFPQDRKGDTDGVVIKQERLWAQGSSTLVHEIGHWMGLKHTFGAVVQSEADDCQSDDGLLETTLTPGFEDVVYKCEQTPCNGDPAENIYNWMSVRPSPTPIPCPSIPSLALDTNN